MFFIGCWAQPMESFKKWKDDGVNIVIGPDKGTHAAKDVRKAAADLGLYYIDVPSDAADCETLVQDKWCYAIGIPDEPELNLPAYNVDPTGFQVGVNTFIMKYGFIPQTVAGRKKLYINFAGPKVTAGTDQPKPYVGQMQKPFADLIPAGSIISMDWYPENMNAARYPSTLPGTAIHWLKTWFPGRDYWAYLECSDQMLDKTDVIGDVKNIGRAPTPAEMEAQLAGLLSEGVKGITWFSHRFMGRPWDVNGLEDKTAWDGRTPDLEAKTREIASRLNPPSDPIIATIVNRLDLIEQKLSTKLSNVTFSFDRT